MIDLDDLEKLLAEASPRPWLHAGALAHLRHHDQALIVAAINALPHLIALARRVNEQPNQEEMPEVAAMRYIEQLRAEEGDSVTICCNDPEAWEKEKQLAIDCNGAWTDWRDRRFYGESVLQCLAKAVTARAALQEDDA